MSQIPSQMDIVERLRGWNLGSDCVITNAQYNDVHVAADTIASLRDEIARQDDVADERKAELTQLRSRLDEVEKERDHWKNNHDNQVRLKQTILDRPDLQDRAKKVKDIIAERDQLRLSNERMEREINTALAHVLELEEAWQRGCLQDHDNMGGTRSNRNVEVRNALQSALKNPPESGSEVRG